MSAIPQCTRCGCFTAMGGWKYLRGALYCAACRDKTRDAEPRSLVVPVPATNAWPYPSTVLA